jgi:hypothetical protein
LRWHVWARRLWLACLDRAYYYYNTEKNKTYEETMIDIAAYAANASLPYRWVLLDR